MTTKIETGKGAGEVKIALPDACRCYIEREPVKALIILRPGVNAEGVDRTIEMACECSPNMKAYLKYVVDINPAETLHFNKVYFDRLRQEAQSAIDGERVKLKEAGIAVEVLPAHFGIAAEEILRAERHIHPDLIVMDVPVYTTLQRVFNRDFSKEVGKKARATVLTITHERQKSQGVNSISERKTQGIPEGHRRIAFPAITTGIILALWLLMGQQSTSYLGVKHLISYSDWGMWMAASMAIFWTLAAVAIVSLVRTLTRKPQGETASTGDKLNG